MLISLIFKITIALVKENIIKEWNVTVPNFDNASILANYFDQVEHCIQLDPKSNCPSTNGLFFVTSSYNFLTLCGMLLTFNAPPIICSRRQFQILSLFQK